MKEIFYDKELQAEFLRKGYVTVPLLSSDEVEYLLNETNHLHPADSFSPRGDQYRFDYHSTLMDSNIEYKQSATSLIRSFFTPIIKNILVEYEILIGGFFVKQPNSGEVVVHRDWTFTNSFEDINVNFWCPLVDVDEINGTLHMVDGTHKLVSNIEAPNTPPFFSKFSESLKEISNPIPLKAGEALFFENTLLHWSTPNRSPNPRFAATFMCVPTGAGPVIFYPDQDAVHQRFKVFEMDSDSFNQHNPEDYFNGRFRTKHMGFVENKNRTLSKDEFFEMMSRGDEIRSTIYSGKARSIVETSFISKIRNAVGF